LYKGCAHSVIRWKWWLITTSAWDTPGLWCCIHKAGSKVEKIRVATVAWQRGNAKLRHIPAILKFNIG
jgi:hypothetical protein